MIPNFESSLFPKQTATRPRIGELQMPRPHFTDDQDARSGGNSLALRLDEIVKFGQSELSGLTGTAEW